MAPKEKNQSWNRELTPSERKFGYIIIGWFSICVFSAFISLKFAISLLALGVFLAMIVGFILHSG